MFSLPKHVALFVQRCFSVFLDQGNICKAKHYCISCGWPWNSRSGLLRQWHDQNTEHWSPSWRRSSIATWCHAGFDLYTEQGCSSHGKVSDPIRNGFTLQSVSFLVCFWWSSSKRNYIRRDCICCWLQNRLVLKGPLKVAFEIFQTGVKPDSWWLRNFI